MLYFMEIVKVNTNVRSAQDRRVFVDQTIASYRDVDGVEYRKAFESKRGKVANVPDCGTHGELHAVKYQWV